MLKEGHKNFDEETRDQYLNLAYSSALGVQTLLENLISWASFQNTKIEPSLKRLSPHLLVEEIVTLFNASISKKEITLVSQIDKGLTLYGDQNMMSTILRNLIANSVKFAPRKAQIIISCLPKTEDVAGLEFKVTNIGNNPQKGLRKVSANGDPVTPTIGTGGEKGLGLGLSLVHDFVEAHNGKIDFKNVGTDAHVIFFIPEGE